MEIEFITKVVVSVAIAAVGWIVAHRFTSHRDMASKRRDIQTKYLIEAYCKIESSIEPEKYSREWCESLQSAIAEIQLFGTKEQIELAHEFSELLLSKELINQDVLKKLLYNLRSSLRNELGLENIDANIGHIRIHETNT